MRCTAADSPVAVASPSPLALGATLGLAASLAFGVGAFGVGAAAGLARSVGMTRLYFFVGGKAFSVLDAKPSKVEDKVEDRVEVPVPKSWILRDSA